MSSVGNWTPVANFDSKRRLAIWLLFTAHTSPCTQLNSQINCTYHLPANISVLPIHTVQAVWKFIRGNPTLPVSLVAFRSNTQDLLRATKVDLKVDVVIVAAVTPWQMVVYSSLVRFIVFAKKSTRSEAIVTHVTAATQNGKITFALKHERLTFINLCCGQRSNIQTQTLWNVAFWPQCGSGD